MNINTKYFGPMEINSEEIIFISEGLFGFESQKQFIIIRFYDDDDTLLCLQSIEEQQLAFIVMNPFRPFPSYAPTLLNSELKSLDATASTDLCYYVIAVVREDFKDSTVNLKCPVVVNPENKKARQIILENGDYSMRQVIVSVQEKGELSCSY